MKKKKLGIVILTTAFAAFAAGAPAQRSTVTFDSQKTVVLDGTVEKFEFVRPNVLTHLAVTTKKGDVQHWVIQMEPPDLALRDGWTENMMKPGDHVTWEVAPAKNGRFVARGGIVVIVNGTKMGKEIQPETVTIPAITK